MGEILLEGWRLYRQHFAVVVGVVLVIYVPIELFSSYMDEYVFEEDDFQKSFRLARFLENFIGIIAEAGIIFVGFSSRQGKTPDVGASLSNGLLAWGRMFWTRLLTGLCILLGLLLLIIPGIYISVRLSLIESVACCEKISGIEAMRRSYALTEGKFWTVFGLDLLLIGMFVVLGVVAVVSAIGVLLVMPASDSWLFDAATSLLIDIAAAYATLCMFAAYAQFTQEVEQSLRNEAEDVAFEANGSV